MARTSVLTSERYAFTAIELMLVISVILILIGLSFPIMIIARQNAKIKSTKMLVTSLHSAVLQYNNGQNRITAIDGTGHYMWTLAQDGTTQALDGDPDLYPSTQVVHSLAPVNYHGFIYMTGLSIDQHRLDQYNRPLDAWRNLVQICWAANTYGGDLFGVWSFGADGVNGFSDDIKSWTNDD